MENNSFLQFSRVESPIFIVFHSSFVVGKYSFNLNCRKVYLFLYPVSTPSWNGHKQQSMILPLLQPGQKVCKCSNKQFNILYSAVLISDFIFSKFSLFFHSFSFPLQMWLCRIYLHFRNWHSLSWIYWSLNSIPNSKLLERNLSAISGGRGEAQQWDPGVNTGHWRYCSWENINKTLR